ncbi:hypothetical protein [Ruegeria arenilitoris]|uniref:hypothetical protein n=1 Tax=Ruegeria arenilitoris TaxID=1173585 RepID=UPI0014814AA5|nr:hypothetical protein [Ruegeria arenilitoris]
MGPPYERSWRSPPCPLVGKEYKPVNIVIAFNPKKETFEVSNPAIRKDKAWIPDIAPLMQGEISQLKLIRQYVVENPEMDEDELERILTRLTGISKKQIGMIELDAELDIETVTEIFIRINREGVTLSQADFAMSKIAANEEFGGNQMRKAIDYFCHLAVAPEFYGHIESNDQDFGNTDYFSAMRWLRNENDDLYDPSYNDMLRVAYTSQFSRGKLADLVGLLSGRNFETRKFENEIAEKAFSDLRGGLLDFMNETNFKRFLMILKSAGFVDSSLISGQAPLNFAYILFLRLRKDGIASELIERFVRKWFALSLLTARYSGSMETRFDQDIRQISEMGMGEYLESIEKAVLSDAFWEVGLVQALTTSNSKHPAFRTFLASQVKSNARGFLSKEITVRSMLEHRGDVHHIFPKDHLKKTLGLTQSQYNQVANLVYTQQEINIAIGNAPPSEYVSDLRKQCNSGTAKYGGIVVYADLEENFTENAVPLGLLTGEFADYQEFLKLRRQSIAKTLKAYYTSL